MTSISRLAQVVLQIDNAPGLCFCLRTPTLSTEAQASVGWPTFVTNTESVSVPFILLMSVLREHLGRDKCERDPIVVPMLLTDLLRTKN